MKGGIPAEMPQKAQGVASKIRNAGATRLRRAKLLNSEVMVKGANSCSLALSAAPLRRRSTAAWRLWFACSHLSDSGIERRTPQVSSPGGTRRGDREGPA